MVAAWMSALTGVGPAIASGSQTCSGNCADLPTAPKNRPMPAQVSSVSCRRVAPALDAREDALDRQRPALRVQDQHADEHADVADARGDERLLGRLRVGEVLAPEPDQLVGAQADQLPADEQQEQVVRHVRMSIETPKNDSQKKNRSYFASPFM